MTVREKKASFSLYPLLLVNFIGTLGYSIVIPFLVYLVKDFGGNALVYGIVGATYSVFQLIGAPLLGRWSDSIGRKRVLLLSQFGTLVSWIIFLAAFYLPDISLARADNAILGQFVLGLPLVLFFAARALDGLTGGNVSVANAYLADITEEKNRNQNYGKMSISANLGFIIGPAMTGVLGATALGVRLPVLAALLISAAALIIIVFLLPESQRCLMSPVPKEVRTRKIFGQEHKECFDMAGPNRLRFLQALKLKGIPLFLSLYFLIFLSFNIFYTAFPIHAATRLNWPVTQMGLFFSLLSLIMIIFQGPVLKLLSRRASDLTLVMIGSPILMVNFLLLVSGNSLLIFLAAIFFAAGNGLMWPSFLSLLSKIAGQKYQGAIQGFASSAGSLASIIGLVAGGFLYEQLSYLTFLIPAGVILSVLFIAPRIRFLEKN